jgi:hypothetical protein
LRGMRPTNYPNPRLRLAPTDEIVIINHLLQETAALATHESRKWLWQLRRSRYAII